jgi:hypothetical protein
VKITIHQALCGEKNKAFDLLRTSLPSQSEAKNIAFKCGLQEQPPSGILWEPSIRAFTEGDYFLLMKTFPDRSIDVRPGRVYTHVLILKQKDVQHIVNIRPLLDFLQTEVDKDYVPVPIVLSITESGVYKVPEDLTSRFNKAIRGFIELDQNSNTIVWVGQERYEDAVSAFWQILSEKDKRLINFGIYFSHTQIPNDRINFLSTPESLENKFLNRPCCVVRIGDTLTLTEFPELILAKDNSAEKRIHAFLKAIEGGELSRLDTEKIGRVIATFENVQSISDFKKLITLSHVVAEYSPDPKKGTEFKNTLLTKVNNAIPNLDEKEIMLLKPFRTLSFPSSSALLSSSIESWSASFLLSPSVNTKKDLTQLVKQFHNANETDLLSKSLIKSIKGFFKKMTPKSAELILVWLKHDVDLLPIIQSDIENTKDAENLFASKFVGGFSIDETSKIQKFAVRRKWFKLHAILLKFVLPLNRALESQLKIDQDVDYYEGIEVITSSSNPIEVIEFTLSNGDERLVNICGGLCNKNPKLLANINITNINWQLIWNESINQGNNLTEGIANPSKVIHGLYDVITLGKSFTANLLDKISSTEFANILSYPQREKLWTKFSSKIKERFLVKTSAALLGALSQDSTFRIPNDNVLASYIFNSEAISTFLYYNSSKIKNALPIFRTYPKLSEHIIERYISNYNGAIDFVTAEELGRLVLARKYEDVAKTIYSKTKYNSDFTPALAICYTVLGVFKQIKLAFSGKLGDVRVPKNKWWDALTEIIIELLPSGPNDQSIWKHSGGNTAKLLRNGTGEAGWLHAIKLIKQEKKGAPSIEDFLRELKRELGKNERVKVIIEYWNKY